MGCLFHAFESVLYVCVCVCVCVCCLATQVFFFNFSIELISKRLQYVRVISFFYLTFHLYIILNTMPPTEGQNIFLIQNFELLHKFHSSKGKKLDLLFQLHDMEETVAKKELPFSGQPL